MQLGRYINLHSSFNITVGLKSYSDQGVVRNDRIHEVLVFERGIVNYAKKKLDGQHPAWYECIEKSSTINLTP